MGQSHTVLCVLHGLQMLLSLTENRAELQLQLAEHVALAHPQRDRDVLEEVLLLEYLNGLLEVNDAFFEHSQSIYRNLKLISKS